MSVNMGYQARWYKLGCPTFKVYPGMLECLLHTKIDVPVEQVRLPFDVFTVQLPLPMLREQPESPGLLGLFVTTMQFGNEDGSMGQSLVILADYEHPDRANIISTAFILRPGTTVEQSLQAMNPVRYDPAPGLYWPSSEMTQDEVKLAVGVALLAIANARDEQGSALVVKEAPTLVEKLKLDKIAKKHGKKAAAWNTFGVGREIVLAKQPSTTRPGKGGKRGRLTYGFIRSGFMRWQIHGPRTKPEHKLIFIRPTRVRPDLPLRAKTTDRAVRRPASAASQNSRAQEKAA